MTSYCRRCREWVWGSHYHCANCGEVTGMYGHWYQGKFECEPKKRKKRAPKEKP